MVEEPQSRLDLAGVSIVIVEDDDDSRDMLQQMVGSFGASVVVARDGEEAKDIIVRVMPDLVFCDLNMPRVDGFQFVSWLRGQPDLCRMPVVALTALGMDADVEKTWAAGFSGHLVKPIDDAVIAAQLRRVFWARSNAGA